MPQHLQEVPITELAKLAFLKDVPQDGRTITATSYYENLKPFHGMLNSVTGEIVVIPNTAVCWGAYWSTSQIDPEHDTIVPLLNTLAQHFSFATTVHAMRGVESDLGNLTAVLEKFLAVHDYHAVRPNADTAVRLMYLSELEYFFGVCRSLIDLMHDCYRHIHDAHFGGKKLPNTFGRFVDREVADLAAMYNLPAATVEYLTQVKPLFASIRTIRDSIFHHGISPDLIFITDQGPAVCLDYPPFSEFRKHFEHDVGYTTQIAPNNIGSLFYIVVSLVDKMLDAASVLARTMETVFSPVPDRLTLDEYAYFLRGPSFVLINRRHELLQECWLRPARDFIRPYLDDRRPFLVPEPPPPHNCVITARDGDTLNDGSSERHVDARREQWIADNAYFRWQDEQRGESRADQHWKDAEREYNCTFPPD